MSETSKKEEKSESASASPCPGRFLRLYEKYQGDRAFTHQILQVMSKDLPRVLEDLDRALHGGDLEKTIKKSHSLANISGTVLEMDIHRYAKDMETAARKGDLKEAAALYACVRPLVVELCVEAEGEITR